MTATKDRPGTETEATGHLQSFEFQSQPVRVVVIDGEPWFVLADLCRVLGLTNPTMVANRLLADGLSHTEVTDSLGRSQQATVVDETNLYEVVLRSDKPEAINFRRWVTGEVLPEIRKTGTYGPVMPTALPSRKELAQWVIDAEERVEVEAKARAEAEARAKELEAPAAAWTELADAAGDYEVADAAKVLSRDPHICIGRDRLFSFMSVEGWIYRGRNARWRAYQAQVDCGRLVEKVGTQFWHAGRGEYVAPEPTVRVTPKGLAELHKRLGGTGQLALVVAS